MDFLRKIKPAAKPGPPPGKPKPGPPPGKPKPGPLDQSLDGHGRPPDAGTQRPAAARAGEQGRKQGLSRERSTALRAQAEEERRRRAAAEGAAQAEKKVAEDAQAQAAALLTLVAQLEAGGPGALGAVPSAVAPKPAVVTTIAQPALPPKKYGSGPFVEEWVFSDADHRARGASAVIEVEQLADRLRERGEMFHDPDFPAAYSVLHRDRRHRPDPARASIFSQRRGSGTVDEQLITWHRPAEIGQKAQLNYSKDVYTSGSDVQGKANIRRLVDDGTITDDTMVFFPYAAQDPERWHKKRRRWADCKHEFAGFNDRSELLREFSTVRPSDIKQGGLGDCYLLAACASIATLPKSYMATDLILDHADVGLYAVKFYVAGRWICVPIDDLFPCTVFNGCIDACCAEPGDGGSIWVMIVEKAFAKLHGSFEAIKSGMTSDALNYLCGGSIKEFKNSAAGGAECAWKELCARVPLPSKSDLLVRGFSGFAGRQALAFFSGSITSNAAEAADRGLAVKHAYSLLGAIELRGSGEKLVEIHDPHGKCEWTGAYRAADSRWTPELKEEVLGHRDAEIDTGSAIVPWDDYVRLFGDVDVCYPFSKTRRLIRRESVLGRWEPGVSAGGPHGYSTFRYNPAFSCSVAGSVGDEIDVNLTLSQPDKRSMAEAYEEEEYEEMHLYCLDRADYDKLCDVLWDGTRQHSHHLPEWVKKTQYRLCLTGRLDQVDLKLMSGSEYILVCCAWSPGVSERRRSGGYEIPQLRDHDFCITVDCGAATLQLTSMETPRSAEPEHRRSMTAVRARKELCQICSRPFEPGESHMLTATGGTHEGECYQQHQERTEPKCLHCSKAVLGSYQSYGKDGEYQKDGKHKVHSDCYQDFEISIGPKCLHCSMPVSRLASSYSHGEDGEYQKDGNQRVHSDCYETYRAARAPKCLHCAKAVTGSFYSVGDDGEYQKDGKHRVHSDCYETYRDARAPKCLHCGKPVVHGSFYPVGDDGRVHSQCYEEYQAR